MKYLTLLCLILTTLSSTFAFAQEAAPDLQARKDSIRNLLEQAYNVGNTADVATLFAADYIRHPDEGNSTSFIISALALRAAMPDLQAVIDLILADGGLVAVRMRMQGTFQNELIFPNTPPVPANGQPVSIAVHLMFRFNEEGLVVEEWDAFDNLHFFAQLGLVPPPQSTPTLPMTVTEVLPVEMAVANKERVTQYLNELNQGNFSMIEQGFRADFVAHNPFGTLDRGGLSVDLNLLRSALPDLWWTPEQILGEGNWVAVLYTMRGTFTNSFLFADGTSIAPTGAALQLLTVALFRFDEQGLVVETWEVYDSLSFLTQLGLLAFVAPGS
jgi:predicted ester cyclase